ncbi:MAG TPA: Uma2 family endonuclease [Firmicutes bacterium]|nr:Uma2 family endonuclease [Bacillota bacterium]
MNNPAIKFTIEEYMAIGESDKRYELIEGELLVTPSPNVEHQRILRRLTDVIERFVEGNDLGEVFFSPLDVILSDTNVVQPDLFFVAKNRLGIITRDNVQGPPDLIVEVLSPSTDARDRQLKRTIYSKYGVKEYWIVDPQARTVEVLRVGPEWTGLALVSVIPEGGTLTTPLLPGLAVPVAVLFSDVH